MTSTARRDVSVETPVVRARWDTEDVVLTVQRAAQFIAGLDDLLWLLAFVNASFVPPFPEPSRPPMPVDAMRQVADETTNNSQVRRLSYQSPLELVFVIFSVGSSGIFIANQLIDIFERVQRARIGRADADLQVTIKQSLREALKDPASEWVNELVETPEGAARLASAALSIAALQSVEVLPEDDM